MALARDVLERLKSSDGRIRIKTLSGVSVLVAVIALLVGVLPVMADDGGSPTAEGIQPHVVSYGGGSGACDFVESDAGFELHINNPKSGPYFGPDGTEVTLDVSGDMFDFAVVSPGVAVYDVVVNGGKQNNHYDYDGNEEVGLVRSDQNLHAPPKSSTQLHNLSHVNICYDVQQVTLVCDGAPEPAVIFGDGPFTGATAQVFNNSVEELDCDGEKQALFFADNNAAEPQLTLEFQGNTGQKVAGRLDVEKDFGEPGPLEDFDDLMYDRDGSGETFVEVPWCETRDFAEGDGTEFSDWLTTGEGGSYPKLPSGETACKVAENEDLTGTQVTVVYFEFEDPQFR